MTAIGSEKTLYNTQKLPSKSILIQKMQLNHNSITNNLMLASQAKPISESTSL
jgi:hypothetical protein